MSFSYLWSEYRSFSPIESTMDPNQLQQLLATLQQQTSQQTTLLSTLLSEIKQQPQGSNHNITPFEHFNANQEKFSSYLERFENYCSMKNIAPDDKKAQLLCVSIGSVHYNNLAALLGPGKINHLTRIYSLLSGKCYLLRGVPWYLNITSSIFTRRKIKIYLNLLPLFKETFLNVISTSSANVNNPFLLQILFSERNSSEDWKITGCANKFYNPARLHSTRSWRKLPL